jgi:CubicO group peptidase (beta-lactamase class C family)
MRHGLLIIIQWVFVFHAEAQVESGPDSLASRIDKYLNLCVANGYAASILVSKDGEIVLSKGYGMADRELKTPVMPSTIFNIGSVTKQFTAAGILKLQESNQLNISDKIQKYFPKAPDDKSSITIHQLLTHTSGIASGTGGFRYQEVKKEDVLSETLQVPLMSVPGNQYTYANANYILLAAIIEIVAEQDYESFMKTIFWDPLQMYHTGYRSFTAIIPQMAHGYRFDETIGEWNDWGTTPDHLPKNSNHWYSVGKGDIQSTVEDLYKWHVSLEEHASLSIEMKNLMESAHVPENDEKTSYYGYGWAIFNTPENKRIIAHNGSNGIYFADFIRYVDDELVIIVLSNIRLNRQSENVAWEIAAMINDHDYMPTVIPKNTYELVFDFMRNNTSNKSKELPQFLKQATGNNLNDPAILNRIGFKQVSNMLAIEWGIELLKLNTELFPNDGNLWDSLGEAFYLINDRDNALFSFKKALDLKPTTNCHWCPNTLSRLKELSNNRTNK